MSVPNDWHRPRWRFLRITTIVPCLVFLTVIFSIYTPMLGQSASTKAAEPVESLSYYQYTTVTGFFLQDAPETSPGEFEFMRENFGLISQAYDTDRDLPNNGAGYTEWQRFEHKLAKLNEEADPGVSYRMLFLGRHGQGYHNVAESYYGLDAWNCYYSLLDGAPDSNLTWLDAHLTSVGIQQAQNVSHFWQSQIRTQKMPLPQTFYVSPLNRCLVTAQLSFSFIPSDEPRLLRPVVKELLREGIGIHTCDKRSSRSTIARNFSDFTIEEGFTEEDELWTADLREPTGPHTARLRRLLTDVFAHDSNTIISMTTHSGSISAILRVVGHRVFSLQVGAVIPVLVKVEKVQGKQPAVPGEDKPWETKPDCEKDPKTAGLEGYKTIEDYYVNFVEKQL